MWRETTKHERNLTIWRDELDAFVPDRVLDFHVHLFNDASTPVGDGFNCGGHPIRHYSFDDLRCDLAELYPGRETSAVCFGIPFVDYDKVANDRYIADGCDGQRFFGFRLLDPAEEPDTMAHALRQDRWYGVKPYLNYVRKADPNQVEIDEMLPPDIMRVIDDLGLIVMLHIPRQLRLADPLNQAQLVRLCTTYPRTRFVLAHVGRSYYLNGVVGQLDRLKDLPNLYYDLAMVMNADVLAYLLQTVPTDRILYATDVPIALAPGHSVEINHQYTYVTPVPWSLSISDDHSKLIFTSFLYEQLRAMKRAAERVGLDRAAVERIFHDNGAALLATVKPVVNT